MKQMIAIGLVAIWSLFSLPTSAGGGTPLRVTLEDVVTLTLQRNPVIQIVQEEVGIGEGRVQASSGAFDWTILSEVSAARIRTPQSGDPITTARLQELGYSLGIQRQFRNGIVVTPNVSVTVSKESIEEIDGTDSTIGRADVQFNILVPLLRGRGSASTGAGEAAAREDLESRRQAFLHELTLQLRTSLQAYWNAVSANHSLDILKQTEDRAVEIEQGVERLRNSGLFSLAFVDQANANSREKKALRIEGEFNVYRSRQDLALTLGSPPEELENPPVPMGTFPQVSVPEAPARDAFAALIQMAFRQRGDYQASIKDQDTLNILERSARRDLKPRLDFSLTFGYTGLNRGANLADPLSQHVRGLNALGTLSLELPLRNDALKGAFIERKSLRRQAELVHQQLSQRIASDVMLALELVKNSYDRLTVSREAEQAYQRAASKEKKRFRIGDVSLLDVFSLEDSYANARLSTIDALRNYLNALIDLRFSTGSLVTGAADQASVPLAQLYAIPKPR